MSSAYQQRADANEKSFLSELAELVSFPSISPDPSHKDDCLACAQHLRNRFEQLGFESQLIPTIGNPLVFAEWKVGPDRPTVLFYGHYDVQLPGDAKLWVTKDPFNATLIDGRIYGRGAEDNKGQFLYVLKALETVKDEGLLNCNVKVLLEGEEETGSAGLSAKIKEMGELVKADILLVCDTDSPAPGRGGISLSLRGNAIVVFTLHGPKEPLHSGMWGGAGPNPITAISKVLGSFHNSDGSIAVEGFLDAVREVTPDDAARIMYDAPSEAQLLKESGWASLAGEPGYPPQIRLALRPTIDPTSVASGEMGQNAIPNSATARINARLVANQNPTEILKLLKEHIKKHTPEGVRLEFGPERCGDWLYLDARDPSIVLATDAIKKATGETPGFLYCGGSVPVVSPLQKASGATPLLIGFGLSDDRIHDIDESMSLNQIKLGYVSICEFLVALSK